MSESPMRDVVEEGLIKLGERWDFVVLTHRPDYINDFRWVVANHTDEGLGPNDDRVQARGMSARKAVENALNGDYYEYEYDG